MTLNPVAVNKDMLAAKALTINEFKKNNKSLCSWQFQKKQNNWYYSYS